MPLDGVIPNWAMSLIAAATVFTMMFNLGLAIVPREMLDVRSQYGLLLRGLFAVLVAVPALAWLVARMYDLPRAAEVGIMLMAIAPGAPVALRSSLGAGGHRALAPTLQIAVAALAVLSMPLSIAVLNEYYGGAATGAPEHLARQVFTAQLLPLGLGMLARHHAPAWAASFAPMLRRLAGVLLVGLVVFAMVDIWQEVVGAGVRVALAVVTITVLALVAGHLLGGPEPATRTATAICSAARNPGLALLVATLNAASPAITRSVLAYFVVAAVTMIPYVVWRRRNAVPVRDSGPPEPAANDDR